jgi:hypothetical protein
VATFATLGDILKHAYSAANFIEEIAMETHTNDDELADALVALAEMETRARPLRGTGMFEGFAAWLPVSAKVRPAENYPGEIVRALVQAPKPTPPRSEYSCDGKTWLPANEGQRLDGARFFRRDGKLRRVRTADGAIHESTEHDFKRWRLLAELEAEDNAPIRERFNPATFDPPVSEWGPGIKGRTFADPRPPYIPTVCDMDLLPDVG